MACKPPVAFRVERNNPAKGRYQKKGRVTDLDPSTGSTVRAAWFPT